VDGSILNQTTAGARVLDFGSGVTSASLTGFSPIKEAPASAYS
jgi:hypothetical protein